MLHGFIINPKDLSLSIEGSKSTLPLTFSASPSKASGMPYGIVSLKGNVYESLPEGLPAIIKYKNGSVEIRDAYNVNTIANAEFVVSGSQKLIENHSKVDVLTPLNTVPNAVLPRIGLGVFDDGRILMLSNTCTAKDLQTAFSILGVKDAILTATRDIYLNYPRGGVKMTDKTPVTIFEAKHFKELPHPIVVLDAGHGGRDTGAINKNTGLREKDVNLEVTRTVYESLQNDFEGTFIVVRDEDVTVELEERTQVATAIGADYYYSIHSNGHKDPKANGFESFVYPTASKTSFMLQDALHSAIMQYLSPFGVRDRKRQVKNLHVLRETKCPAVLIENLFITNAKDAEFLSDSVKLEGLGKAIAKGIAEGLNLKPKLYEDVVDEPTALYTVQVGAFRFKKNAETMLDQLKRAGFEGFLDIKNSP